MAKLVAILTISALAAACAHTEAETSLPVAAERDWKRGLEPMRANSIAPVGPIDSDQRAYDIIRRREQQHALGTKATALELDDLINNSSQVLASAMSLPLFKAGVYLGLPCLIEKGCTAARRVTHSALRSPAERPAPAPAQSARRSCARPTRFCLTTRARPRVSTLFTYSTLAATT